MKNHRREYLEKAYNAYLEYEENDEQGDEIDEIIDECDSVFYENESKIEDILKEHAKTIEF